MADYFFDFMEGLDVGLFASKGQQEIISRTKKLLTSAKELKRVGDFDRAEYELSKLFYLPSLSS